MAKNSIFIGFIPKTLCNRKNSAGASFIRLAQLFLFLLVVPLVNSYPSITSDYGTNHTRNKELIHSIPEKYFDGVDSIEFTGSLNAHYSRVNLGYYRVNWYRDNFYGAKIWVYAGYIPYWNGTDMIKWGMPQMNRTLKHELGHHDWYYNKHNKVNDENYANKFEIR